MDRSERKTPVRRREGRKKIRIDERFGVIDDGLITRENGDDKQVCLWLCVGRRERLLKIPDDS